MKPYSVLKDDPKGIPIVCHGHSPFVKILSYVLSVCSMCSCKLCDGPGFDWRTKYNWETRTELWRTGFHRQRPHSFSPCSAECRPSSAAKSKDYYSWLCPSYFWVALLVCHCVVSAAPHESPNGNGQQIRGRLRKSRSTLGVGKEKMIRSAWEVNVTITRRG